MKTLTFSFFLTILLNSSCHGRLVVNTWRYPDAAEAAWSNLVTTNVAIDALVAGCSYCEANQCGLVVGFGGSPDESGETTLDSLIYDGATMDAGAVGDLRRVKSAMAVAKHVLQFSKHTLLVGDQATAFAVQMGFTEEYLGTNVSRGIWQDWQDNDCQPNFWKNVIPDPDTSCGPYTPISEKNIALLNEKSLLKDNGRIDVKINHDTIGMIVLNNDGNLAAGTSTNGLRYKIPGRVGDSPVPGAGAYADDAIGAACATGNGDIMMRFLPSFLAVEKMRDGASPSDAARLAVARIAAVYPEFSGAVIAVSANGDYGAACNGMAEFPFSLRNDDLEEATIFTVDCTNVP